MHISYKFTLPLFAALVPMAASAANRHRPFEDMAASSDKVVLATVGTKTSYYGPDSRIYTEAVLYPDVTVKGSEDGAVVVQSPGGTVGDVTMTVSDGPELPQGARVLVFLRREGGRFAVTDRSAGAVAATSSEAAQALDSAFTAAERTVGRRLVSRRGLAATYLDRAAQPPATRNAAGTSATVSSAQVGCYSTDGAKWGTGSPSYKIGTSIPAAWNAAIDAATATWNAAGANFRFVSNPSSANEISYLDLSAKYGPSYDNTYAVTTTWASTTTHVISKATIEVHTKWPWAVSGASNTADVQNILTHEFGHWMRLLDIYSPSECGAVTMWGTAPIGETAKRTLAQADIDGLLSLYGAGNGGSTAVTAPSLAAPGNGATGQPATITLSWTAATNATAYDIYLGTSASPAYAGNTGSTSWQPPALQQGTTYYWRVAATNAIGSASSQTWSFTTASAPAPATGPTLLSPGNGATGVSRSPLLQWTAVTGATGYDVYLSTSSPRTPIGTVPGTQASVSGLRARTSYSWKIVAHTPSGDTSSSTFTFRTN